MKISPYIRSYIICITCESHEKGVIILSKQMLQIGDYRMNAVQYIVYKTLVKRRLWREKKAKKKRKRRSNGPLPAIIHTRVRSASTLRPLRPPLSTGQDRQNDELL